MAAPGYMARRYHFGTPRYHLNQLTYVRWKIYVTYSWCTTQSGLARCRICVEWNARLVVSRTQRRHFNQ